MYIIQQIKNDKEWESFLLAQPYTLFVQAPTYGHFYSAMHEDYWIFGIYSGHQLIGGSLAVSVSAKRGKFLYLPYGPILDFNNQTLLNSFIDFLKKFAIENKFDFVRFSPFANQTELRLDALKKLGLRSAPMHMLAETTWLLDINISSDELLANMKKNHRNLIRRCAKEGVRIEKKVDQKMLDQFNCLHDETVKKHRFYRFSREYINNEFRAFASTGNAVVFESYLPDGRLDASAIIIYYGNMAVYRHAASLNLNNKIPTSYLIQWEAINEAKRRGIKWYNFWGIAPEGASQNHPFTGIAHFKKGFGGFQKNLLHCHDLPITNRYWLNWVIETFRRIKRGF
ncbi:MAG: peptidoglycan bridge formation glycyltransferase FemA/FemB family protein [Patescibacteria group bacterium]